ncbi:hypothetical protein PMKS-001620 [Pichia membranifaciens]|uniref:UBX domain-containing protein n=1 Tax=Pichia membranifaciens TaxID=4926 RepID=A0A1Q2YF95_9ASCO|nr:hypothetical protein PMKS-001620 [Pichia membranifaciens]
MLDDSAPAERNLAFNSDVMASIQSSITLRKPLMLFIENPASASDSGAWLDRMIFGNQGLTEPTKQLLSEEFIRLQIVKNSADFNNLVLIIPSFRNAITPCIFFIYSGQVVDAIPEDFDVGSIEEKIKQIHHSLHSLSGRDPLQTAATSPPPPQPSTTTAAPQVTSTPTGIPSNTSASSSNPPNNNSNPIKQEKRSLKEESAELAALRYRENLLKQQRQAKLDRERILYLLDLDRKEQRNKLLEREKLKQQELEDNAVLPQHIRENLHNSKVQNSSTYNIQLKLLDGTTARHKFKSDQKLSNVRDFVLRTYPDYNSFPFYFFKTIDRITFGEADENKSLMSLNLNMATLILKPVEPEESQQVSTAADNTSSSTFSWLKNKMFSYLWSADKVLHESNLNQENRSRPPINDGSYTSSIMTHPYVEDESDNDTIYHTPVLASTTPSSSSLRPTMSSFNLYGSQGLIHPTSTTSSTNDLQNLLPRNIDQREEAFSEPSNEDSTVSHIVSNGNSNQSESSVDRNLRTVRNAEDVDVNNGNSISLQFPDDD